MSEPDNPRWLDELAPELRREVPVREAWRARLLAEIAREPRPSAADRYDEPWEAGAADAKRHVRGRRIILRPLAGVAAALVFAALGAAATLATLSWRARGRVTVEPLAANVPPAPSPVIARDVAGSADSEVVRFELSAPKATHVALVGSFNRWNPVATPLERDSATGTWRVAVRLPPGRHVYAFVVDGDVTADPAAPRAADDDFGSSNSVVLVSGPAS